MIPVLLFALAVFVWSPDVTVTFTVAGPVQRVTIMQWADGQVPRVLSERTEGLASQVTVSVPPSESLVAQFTGRDGRYLLFGPFVSGTRPLRFDVAPAWYRSAQGSGVSANGGALRWIAVTGGAAPWPRCWWAARTWTCLGIPASDGGAVLELRPGGISSSFIAPGAAVGSPWRDSAWARMVRVETPAGIPLPLATVRLRQAGRAPAGGSRSVRVAAEPVRGATVSADGRGAFWLTGPDISAVAWIEAEADGWQPAYLPLDATSLSDVDTPLAIALGAARRVAGTIVDPIDAPVAGALVTLFRFIDPDAPGKPPPRRVPIAEVTSKDDGSFGFGQVSEDERYEIVVWNARFGRKAIRVRAGEEGLAVRLVPSASAAGRVLMDGQPAAGVPVVAVPDTAALGRLADFTEGKGGDTRTAADGSFFVSLPSAIGGELRIGDSSTGVKRIPLAAGEGRRELGDIELGATISVTLELDVSPACALTLVGPVGRVGLMIVPARASADGTFNASIPEPGVWALDLSCDQAPRRTSPSAVRIGPTDVRFRITVGGGV